MAEVKKVAALTEEVEKVVIEEVETRPEGFELFITREEAKGLRTFLGLGTTSKTLRHLGIEGVWEALYSEIPTPDWVDFDQIAKLEE